MRTTAIPLAARQEVIQIALQFGDVDRAYRLRGDLYRELLEFIAHHEQEDGLDEWPTTIEDFLKTDQLGFE